MINRIWFIEEIIIKRFLEIFIGFFILFFIWGLILYKENIKSFLNKFRKKKIRNKKMKLNIGCGKNYRKGWTNMDFNKEVKADIYWDIEKSPLPFENNLFDYVLVDNVLEHIIPMKLIGVLEELHRITKPNSIIDIYVPHYSSCFAFSHITHFSFFGIGKFNTLSVDETHTKEKYSKCQFKVKEKLLFFHHNYVKLKFLNKLPINWIFNFSFLWQKFMEKFNPFSFDEINYKLKVIKN